MGGSRVKQTGETVIRASDKLWTYADFESLPGLAVATALSRMVKDGSLD